LPESVERELRSLLKQDDGGILSENAVSELKQKLEEARETAEARDGNDDKIALVGECEIVADGSLLLAIILDGLGVRLVHPIERDERLRLAGER